MTFLRDTYTIWLREMYRFRRNKTYLFSQIFFPLIIIIFVGLGFENIVDIPDLDINYLDFLSSGFLVIMIAGSALGGGFNLIKERVEGFLREIIVAPVSRYSIILGKSLSRITVSTFQAVIVLGLLTYLTNLHFRNLGILILSLSLIAFTFVSFGIILASLLRDLDSFRFISGFVMMPIYFLSGVFFPISSLPNFLEVIAKFNPLTYAVDLFRYSTTGLLESSLFLDIIILLILSFILFIFSTFLFDKRFKE